MRMHAEITSESPGNRWDDRPVKTFRARRPQRWAVDVVKNSGMPLDSCALYILLIDLPAACAWRAGRATTAS
jgi:hypothetical protein